MAKFVITEEQYNKLMEWGNESNQNSSSNKQHIPVKITGARNKEEFANQIRTNSNIQTLSDRGLVPDISGSIEKNATQASQTPSNQNPNQGANAVVGESRIITKKELTENHFKRLKQNSKLYTVKDFLKK